ncbi:hypothetical protein QYM36_014685 [Artemia franciscana]|nr:hypothetical protein QYM36_014685 [Artemia franciscana]
MTDTRRRVKLYALNADRQWDDRGTGHVQSLYVDKLKGVGLVVRAESDGNVLLESKIQPDTAYQKQQETLIVWSEGDNYDLALSFQERAGCDEIWEKICQVQGKDPSVDITQDFVEDDEDERFDELSDPSPAVELPNPEMSKLDQISEIVHSCLTTAARREKLALALETDNYIRKLLVLFHECEDLDNITGLHRLYEIFKNIFLLNKNALFEIMFAEDVIFDVVGCLEYDPNAKKPKCHREYLRKMAKFREVVSINNPELLSKIHQTYRVQYIQDVILPPPSVFEENLMSSLSSFIFFNKVEIVSLIQEDERFLSEIFNQLSDETLDDQKRRDLVCFLKEFCTFSQTLQQQSREAFYKTLTSLGVLAALETTLAADDLSTKLASIDILSYIVEFSPSLVREYILQQNTNSEDEALLLNVIIEQLVCDNDPEIGGAVQLCGILRILLDPENMMASMNKSEKTDFLSFFYKHSVHVLIGLSLGFCTSHNVTIIRLLDNPHNSNDELKHIRKDSINASFIKVPGDWDVPGGWTIFPLIERLSLLNADWVLIVSEKTKLNLALLLDVVSSYNKNEPEFIGHVIIDSEPTIIHHYSDSQLSYPLKNSGFLLSKLVVSRLAAAISSDIPRSSFSIDVVYEFAAYLKKQLGVKLKRDRRFCISDDTGCLTSVLTHSKFKRSSKVRRDEIFVGVKTFSGFHSSRVPVVQKTWGKSAEKIVFFSDIEDPSIPTLSTGIKNIERGHCGKTAFILEYFSQLMLEDSVLKWLLVADDDTIISLENLREVLSDFDTGKPMIIGERYGYGWNDRSSGYDYITG